MYYLKSKYKEVLNYYLTNITEKKIFILLISLSTNYFFKNLFSL